MATRGIIKYNGTTIADFTSGTKTVLCSNKFMEGNIEFIVSGWSDQALISPNLTAYDTTSWTFNQSSSYNASGTTSADGNWFGWHIFSVSTPSWLPMSGDNNPWFYLYSKDFAYALTQFQIIPGTIQGTALTSVGFSLLASNDGSNWTTMGSWTNNFAQTNTYTIDIDNYPAIGYRYYKWLWNENLYKGGTQWSPVGYIRLYGRQPL